MIRRPRSVAIPVFLTVLTLVGLTLRVARFGERITIRILSPAATHRLQVVHPGQTIRVEAIVDAGDAVYKAVKQIWVVCTYTWTGRRRPTSSRTLVTTCDPITKRFAQDIEVLRFPAPARGSRRTSASPRSTPHIEVLRFQGSEDDLLSIDVQVIDRAGRGHTPWSTAPAGSPIWLRIEPAGP